MNNKITFPELVEAVSQATNTTKRVSETFLKELFAVITETLASGENVKIKNFGTFKVVDVDSRKSVNVNTGAEIEIPAHKKVSFTPEKTMAEALNKPFENFETVVLDDDISEEDMKVLLDVEMPEPLPETKSAPKVEPVESPEESKPESLPEKEVDATNQETESAQPVAVPPPFIHEVVAEEKATEAEAVKEEVAETIETAAMDAVEPRIEEPVVETERESEPQEACEENESVEQQADRVDATQSTEKVAVMSVLSDKQEDDKQPSDGAKDDNNSVDKTDADEVYSDDEYEDDAQDGGRGSFKKGFLWGFVAALLLCAVAGYCFYALCLAPRLDAPQIVQTSIVGNSVNVGTDSIKNENTFAKDTIATKNDSLSKKEKSEAVKVQVVMDTVSEKRRYLASISRKHYGSELFWVYIYEENKDKIPNPNAVSIGTVVVIPPAGKYGIDKNDKASVDKAKAKAYEILSPKQ